jgi:hypothetical protein
MLSCGPFRENDSANLMGQAHKLPEEGGGGVRQLFPRRSGRWTASPGSVWLFFCLRNEDCGLEAQERIVYKPNFRP